MIIDHALEVGICEKTLTDGSQVYDIHISGNEATVMIDAESQQAADILAEQIAEAIGTEVHYFA